MPGPYWGAEEFPIPKFEGISRVIPHISLGMMHMRKGGLIKNYGRKESSGRLGAVVCWNRPEKIKD